MNDVILFDTLDFSKRLQAAGVPEASANAQAEVQKDFWDKLANSHFSTKDDIKVLQGDTGELKSNVKALKLDVKTLKDDVKSIKAQLKNFVTKDYLRKELERFATKEDLAALKEHCDFRFESIDKRIGRVEWRMMSMMGVSVAFLSGLMSLLHFI